MKFALISSRAPRAYLSALEGLGYTVLPLPPFECLSPPVDTHADMLFFSYDNILITSARYYERAHDIFDMLCHMCGIEAILCDREIKGDYPHDIAYNALVSGGALFAKLSHTSVVLQRLAQSKSLSLIDVSQGYTACSTLDLGEGNVITADDSLFRAYSAQGMNVTKITNGSVALPPYDYGFIGGCAGVDGDTVYFCGDISTHSDAELIKKAIDDRSMTAISLSTGPLFDVGGIKFFHQKI